jgi:D-amino peptidase
MEGVAGVVYWPVTSLGGRDTVDDERQRKAMAADINAAIRGAWAGGARELVVAATHGSSPPRPNLVVDDIDERASVFHGQFSTRGGIINLLEPGYDAAFLIGMHSRNETADGILSHTFSSTYRGVHLNGEPIGEIGIDCLTLGAFGVPVALVTGDSAAVREAEELLGDAELVTTKTGLAHGMGLLTHPQAVAREIEAAARRALERLQTFQPCKMEAPYRFEVELGTSIPVRAADACSLVPDVERLSSTAIAFESTDILTGIRMLRALHVLAGTQR